MLALPLLMLAPALAQDAVPHAQLHPPVADFYLEVPNVGALTAGLSKMPLVQTWTDPELREATAAWIDYGTMSPATVLSDVLGLAGVPASGAAELAGVLLGVRGASLSLSGLAYDLDRSRAELRALTSTFEELDTLAGYLREAGAGGLPENLAELDVAPELLRDAWDRPYEYRRIDGPDLEFELFSLGSDGAPGGTWLAADLHHDDATEPRVAGAAYAQLGLLIVLDFERAELAEACTELLWNALAGTRAELTELPALTLAAGTGSDAGPGAHRALTIRDIDYAPPVWIARDGNRVALGLGTVLADEVAARVHKPRTAPSLANSGPFQATRAALGKPSTAPILQGFSKSSLLGLLRPLDLIQASLAPSGASRASMVSTVLDWFTGRPAPRAWRMLATGDRVVTESFTQLDSTADSWFATTPVSFTSAKLVPADAMAVLATSINAAALGAAFNQWLEADEAGAAKRLTEQLGFDPVQDVFGNLGDTLSLSCQPLSGLTYPKATAFIDLKDPVAFEAALEKFVSYLGEHYTSLVSINVREYHDVPLITVAAVRTEGSPLGPFAPTLCILEGRLMIALTNQQAKREVKRLESTGPDSDLHPLFARDPEGALLVAQMDWGELFLGIESIVRAFGSMAAGFINLDIDLNSLPSVELLTARLRPTVRVHQAVTGGVRVRHEASFGPETWIGVPLFGAASFARSTKQAYSDVRSVSPSAGEPPSRADESTTSGAPRTTVAVGNPAAEATTASLAELKLGLGTYQAVEGGLPATLEALVVGTEMFPSGFLGASELPTDGWGRAFVYVRAGDGASYELRSLGPNAIDDGGGGDDIAVD